MYNVGIIYFCYGCIVLIFFFIKDSVYVFNKKIRKLVLKIKSFMEIIFRKKKNLLKIEVFIFCLEKCVF